MAESTPHADESLGLPRDSRGVFVGRQREMAELTAALHDALAGQGRLVMLAGEPGIGKTRTAQELASYAVSRGAQVLWGKCYEEEGAPPYWPWIQPLRSYVQETEAERLGEALALAEELGMPPVQTRVAVLREKLKSRPTKTAIFPDGLTPREVEVLRLIAQGKTNQQIADELFISPNTVLHHVSNILSKTGCPNRAGVATYAAQQGLTS